MKLRLTFVVFSLLSLGGCVTALIGVFTSNSSALVIGLCVGVVGIVLMAVIVLISRFSAWLNK